MRTTALHSIRRGAALLLAAALVPAAAALVPATAGAKSTRATRNPDPPATLQQAGAAFEAARLLAGAGRVAALEQSDRAVEALLRRGHAGDDRAAARFLSGEIRLERGDPAGAAEQFRRAQDGNAFAADAAFAAIQALEAAGRDDEAAREWTKWEKRWPKSPLRGEALLAQTLNALRRGKLDDARAHMASTATAAPWMTNDPRLAFANALAWFLDQRPAEALVALGPAASGAGPTYLRALCYRAQGSLLKSAALFQEAAERYPDSPLRDHALFAKADAFLTARDYRSAGEEFARVAARVRSPEVRAESELRGAGALFLGGQVDSALTGLRALVARYPETDVAARAQFLVGEALVARGQDLEAIVEYNRVLSGYFRSGVAASAQYRVARCLDRLGRRADATGAYQAVVSGYALAPEAPAAAYLAGVGLMERGLPLAATPYFQLVLDRYAARADGSGQVVFAALEHQELVEAALCLLELSYHRTGNLGQLSGAPHLLLHSLPPSRSPWRAYALLIDADAAASQARYAEAQATLEQLTKDYPDHAVAASATKLLAWTYARQGRDSLAIATEERLLARYGGSGREDIVSAAVLDIAHERFNQKRYKEAAAAYADFLHRYPAHPRRLEALYQAGLCYLRLDHAGDAVDRWEAIVRDSGSAALAERAWARMGDVYFQAERYDDARRCYHGLLERFEGSPAAGLASLRLAQCDYNQGRDAAALERFSSTIEHYPGTPAAREAQRGTEASLYRLSQSAKGSQELARLIEQFPTSAFAADAQFQIGRRAYQEKKYAEAAEAFRQVVSRFPGSSSADQAQFLMADALLQTGAKDEARTALEQFLSFFPGSDLASSARFRLGLLQFEAKDYMRAAVAFTRVLDDSASAEVRGASRYNLALCHRMLGDAERARAELERYRQEFPGDARAADVAYQLGDLSDAANDPPAARAEFERALALKPKPALAVELTFRIGRAHELAGEPEAALRSYRNAATLGGRDNAFRLSAVARAAALYEKKKDFARAMDAYRDIARNAKDRELAAAAAGRVSQLESAGQR